MVVASSIRPGVLRLRTGTRHGVIVCSTWTSSQISKVCTIGVECEASGSASAGIKTRRGSCTAGGCAGAGAECPCHRTVVRVVRRSCPSMGQAAVEAAGGRGGACTGCDGHHITPNH